MRRALTKRWGGRFLMNPWFSLGIWKMERKKSRIFKRAKQKGKTVWKNQEEERRGIGWRKKERQRISSWKMVLPLSSGISVSRTFAYKCSRSSVSAWCACDWETMACLGWGFSISVSKHSVSENTFYSFFCFSNLNNFFPKRLSPGRGTTTEK